MASPAELRAGQRLKSGSADLLEAMNLVVTSFSTCGISLCNLCVRANETGQERADRRTNSHQLAAIVHAGALTERFALGWLSL